MTSFFLDVNVWLALSDITHVHHRDSWRWLGALDDSDKLIFCRQTQVGLLRLLTNRAVMNHAVLTLGQAWDLYDEWLLDPRVQFHPEPHDIETSFRKVTGPFLKQPVPKVIGDSYLLAFAQQSGASLVTFDQALAKQARKVACASIIPS